MRRRGAATGKRQHTALAVPVPPTAQAAEPTVGELRTLTERLLLAGLREQEISEERRRAEDAMRVRYDEEHRLRAGVEHMATERQAMLGQISAGILIADAEGRITYINAAARRILGLAELGVAVEEYAAYELITVPGDPFPSEQLARAVGGNETVRDLRRRIRRPDGTEVVTDGAAEPFFDGDGGLLGAVLVLRDVTTEAALERQKNEALTAAAHDLRSPLSAILGFSQILAHRAAAADAPGGDRWLAPLGQIDRAATRMNAMIDDLLDLGRLQLGQALGLERQPIDFLVLARRVVADYQQRAADHRFLLESATETLVGRWDAARLERALANLLDNAIKYSPAGGAVVLRLEREANPTGDWAVLSVEDHGIGIPTADLPQVFERFRRGSNVVGRIAGTGIGLASAKQIAVEHGGALTVASVGGQGSIFALRLPLAPPDEA